MTPTERYEVDRALWLYARLRILMDRGPRVVRSGPIGFAQTGEHRRKICGLTLRITRWLVGASATQRTAYYQGLCAAEGATRQGRAGETTHARVARRRGRRLIASLTEAERRDIPREETSDVE